VIAPDNAALRPGRTIFYGGIGRRPAAIVRPTDASDVSQVVSIARDTGLELAVRSGGHSLAGNSTTDGGIVLDLADMNALEIDPQDRTARAETGLTASAYSTAAGAYGLATGFGDTGSVGIGGLTLGGGIGLLVRKHGLTIDDLPAAELVTADGQLLRVDDQTHPDLYWALRGGGGNFGVATRFRFRLHPVDQIVGGLLLPAPPDTIAAFVAEAEAAPKAMSTIANVMPAPPLPFVPATHHGVVIMATLAYAGDPEAGKRASFRALATPIADLVRPMPYPEIHRPRRRGSTRPRRCARFSSTPSTATRPQRSSSTLRPRPPRCWWPSSGSSGARWRACPPRPSAFAHRASRLMPRVWPMSWGLLGSQ
jgi:FAD/FMN-containing dehydrogenase